jgi:hypothetical protein
MAMLQDVIGGFTMEFIVQAVNGSQSRASDPIVVTSDDAGRSRV